MIDDLRRAAVVAIGDELITGQLVDTNSGWISEQLAAIGIAVSRCVVAGDDAAELERLFYELCSEFQIVVATGGLGPTQDDVTRHAAARAAGVPLALDVDVEAGLRALWRERGLAMPESNLRQALFPQGAQVLRNEHGTAPGFRVWIEGGCLTCLPGPPREMRPMVAGELAPWLARTCGVVGSHRLVRFYLVGLSESEFGERAGDWMERAAEPRMGVCAGEGVLTVRIAAQARSAAEADRQLAGRAAEFRERFARWIFSESEPDLALVVGAELVRRGLTLATAESCTGGLLAARLCALPGISAALLEGWVVYSDAAKTARLGVPPEVLEREGAVSEASARALAEGAARASGARIAVAITGLAGPGGGTPRKPVGLVWFGLCVDGRVQAFERRFSPVGRQFVRELSVHTALDLVRRNLPEH